MKTLPLLFGYDLSGVGNSHVPLSLCRHWNESGFGSRLYAPSSTLASGEPWVRTAMGPLKRAAVYRLTPMHFPGLLTERFFSKREKKSAHVYLWAGLSLGVFERFKAEGARIVMERINCHQAAAKRILDRAHKEAGFPANHGITDESMEAERRKLALADAVFCPSPMVRESMVENGVPEEKLLSTSYGWDPSRFPRLDATTRNNEKPTFLFVGRLCVRKGVPLLLEAWEEAGVDARLILCGEMDASISSRYGEYFKREDIVHVPFTRDIGKYYNLADAFLFPTLEEGGPMVTYEAMAHGLMPVVSPMGAGAIVENIENGLVLGDRDRGAWADAIRTVCESGKLREWMGRAAAKRALSFTWDKVAEQRARLLRDKFPTLW